jgi:hypothetical protein
LSGAQALQIGLAAAERVDPLKNIRYTERAEYVADDDQRQVMASFASGDRTTP